MSVVSAQSIGSVASPRIRARRFMALSPNAAGRLLLVLIAVLLLSPLAVLGLCFVPQQTRLADSRTTYVGEINSGQAWLSIARDGSGYTGQLELADGREFVILNNSAASGHRTWAVTLTSEGDTAPPSPAREDDLECDVEYGCANGTWSTDEVSGGLEGVWTGGPPEYARPISFKTVATAESILRVAGLRVGERGRTVEYRVSFPKFVGKTPLDRAAETALQHRIADFARSSASWPWDGLSELVSTFRDPEIWGVANQWEYVDDWRVTYRSETILSCLCGTDWFTGGAHGNSTFASLVLWWNGRVAQYVRLEDLFRPGSDWIGELLKFCTEDLGRQRRDRSANPELGDHDLEPAIDLEDLGTFTVHESGLRFHFPPYSVGCYAEGSYDVLIPWRVVRPLSSENGPATSLPQR